MGIKRLLVTLRHQVVSFYDGILRLIGRDRRAGARRRSYAARRGELEQIQFLLGHESILTTERYLGSEQDRKNAANDALVFE